MISEVSKTQPFLKIFTTTSNFTKLILCLLFQIGTKSKIFAPLNPNLPGTHNNNHDIVGS